MKSLVFVCASSDGTTTANGHPLVMLIPEADPDVFRDVPKGGLEFVVTNEKFKHGFKQNRRYEVSFRLLSDVLELPGDAPAPEPVVVGDDLDEAVVVPEEPPVPYEKDEPSVDSLAAAPEKPAPKPAPAKRARKRAKK